MNKAFKKFAEAKPNEYPFPHIVIENFLDEELASELLKRMPRPSSLSRDASITLKKHIIHFTEALVQENSDDILYTFTKENANQTLFQLFIEKFRKYISSQTLPSKNIAENEYAYITDSPDVRLHKKLIIDGGFNTIEPFARKGASCIIHLDSPLKYGNIIIYLKHSDDTDDTGALLLYKMKKGAKITLGQKNKIDPADSIYFEVTKRIPYRHNTLIAFPNHPRAFHGIEPRENLNFLRYAIVFGFDAQKRLHNFALYYQGIKKIRHVLQFYKSRFFN